MAEIARAIEEERQELRQLPPMPDDCNRRERTGVQSGERLDLAALKGDQAVGRANARLARCVAWYEGYRQALAEAGEGG